LLRADLLFKKSSTMYRIKKLKHWRRPKKRVVDQLIVIIIIIKIITITIIIIIILIIATTYIYSLRISFKGWFT
jgi:hypothetical protein